MNYSHPVQRTPFGAGQKMDLLLFISFCLVQAGLLLAFGIYTQEEAVKYVYEAGYFTQHGGFSQPKYVFYSGYIFLHILSNAVNTGFAGVYIFQLLLNGLATYCFYRLALQVSASRIAAFVSTLLLILCIPFQKWTVYLFTESVFFSLMIIYCYVLFKTYRNGYAKPLLALLLLFLLVICRPTGMLAIPATAVLASVYLFQRKKKLWALAIWVPGLIGLVLLLDTAFKGRGEFDFMKPFIEEHIICGLPTNKNVVYSNAEHSSLTEVLSFIGQHFFLCAKLGIMRLAAFFGLVRPYYSGMHNFLLGLGFYPVYLLALFGWKQLKKQSKAFHIFSFTLIATFALSVMVTCDDWHNRFIMPIMPLILLYAGMGAARLYTRYFKKEQSITSRQ